MYCSGCGQALNPGEAFCSKCGRPIAPAAPPVPGLQFEVERYASKIKTLSVFWFIYAALGFILGVAGLTFAKAFFSGGFGPWMNGPWQHGPVPFFLGGPILGLIWTFLVLRSVLALAAGWGLMEHAPWGRMVAIVAAILSLIKFPFGTALGIATLVILLGYRNSTLYDHL
jgi:hypothetical protein